jgi:hypothetical protein
MAINMEHCGLDVLQVASSSSSFFSSLSNQVISNAPRRGGGPPMNMTSDVLYV